jgi:hypothetical protein
MPTAPRKLKSGVRLPAPATLKKYGMTEGRWLGLLAGQGGVCPICLRVPPSGVMAVDHEHVKGWKKMRPAERAGYVRGILCIWCNRWALHYAMTTPRAERIANYLIGYDERKAA